MKLVKKLAFVLTVTFSLNTNAVTLIDMEIGSIQQYGADGLTVVSFKNTYTSPNNCSNSTWGTKSVLLRSAELHAEKILGVALAAMMAGKRVDVGLKNSCDMATESIHFIRVKN